MVSMLFVYRAIVRAKIRGSFERLNVGDPAGALALMADDVHYRFEGHHALGGERSTKAGVTKWFGRLLRLFKSRFVLRRIEVAGWPWRSLVTTEFDDHVTPPVGEPYVNHGVQVAEIRWGKATRIRTYVDTARLEHVLATLAAAGVDEASATPIEE